MVINKLWDKLERYKKCPYRHINIEMTLSGLLLSFFANWALLICLLAFPSHPCLFCSHMLLHINDDSNPHQRMAPPTVPAIVTAASCLFRTRSFPITLSPFSLQCQTLLRPTPSSGTMRPRDSCQHIVILQQAASAKN